jgi:long-chain acyl-CoA synthetase
LSSPSIAEDLPRIAESEPDKLALVAGERMVSYGELQGLVESLAAGLHKQGVGPGDRVAIMLPNGVDAVVAIQGTLRAGAAIMPVNPTAKHERLSYLLEHSGAALLLCDEERAAIAAEAVADGAGDVPWFSRLEDLGDDGPAPQLRPGDDDLAALLHTSGSTGGPKGVMHGQGGLSFVTDSIVEYLDLSSEDRVLSVLPLSFGYGLSQLLICLRVGATLVLEPGFGLPGRIVQLLEQHEVTGLPGVPTVFQVLLSLHGLADRGLPHLRFLTNAGAALPTPAIGEVRRTFPNARFYSMYGQTECIRTCYLPPEQLDIRPSAVGVPIPGTEVWIENEGGERLGPGEVGELIVRGRHVMQGYWGNPEATAERVREGREPGERLLATDDLFRTDEEGYLYFVSRRDDIIKSRGEKVPPREVEEVLHRAAGVSQAVVVGVPDRLLGEAVHAHVVPQEEHQLDPAALRRYCAEHLEDYMVPKRVVVHDELPRTSNGKIDRLALARS